jgi:hypothetical protein
LLIYIKIKILRNLLPHKKFTSACHIYLAVVDALPQDCLLLGLYMKGLDLDQDLQGRQAM